MAPEQENAAMQLPASTSELEALIRKVYREESAAEKTGKKILTKEEMRAALLNLPDSELLREYETTVAKGYADKWSKQCIHGDLVELIDLIKAAPEKDSPDWKVAFGAFAVAVNYERLNKNYTAEKKLLDNYRQFFAQEHPFFLHLDVLYRMGLVDAKDAKDPDDAKFLENLLFDAKENGETLAGDSAATGNYGGYHAFAELTAHLFESSLEPMNEFLTDPASKWLEHARDAANMAIAGDKKYAKYYCTCGRVLAQQGKLEEAISYVSKAIDLEDSSRTDYAIRIGDYAGYRQQFRAQQTMQQQKAVIDKKVQEVSQQMEIQEKETMTKNMEFLGLFSGIVSFTIGSLTLASNFSGADAIKVAGLIVVLLGALICVYAAFGVILHGFFGTIRDKYTGELKQGFIFRHTAVFILGALVIIGGILFCIR